MRSDWEAELSGGLGVSTRRVGVVEMGVDTVIGVVDRGDGVGEPYEWSRSTYEVDTYSIKKMDKSEANTMRPVKSPIFDCERRIGLFKASKESWRR